jgi:hypothetical protein
MSTHVVGFKPADEKYHLMFTALLACREAGVKPPPEVVDFFGGCPEEANAEGVQVDLEGFQTLAAGVEKWSAEYSDGFQVDLRKLDPAIKILRFYNSW